MKVFPENDDIFITNRLIIQNLAILPYNLQHNTSKQRDDENLSMLTIFYGRSMLGDQEICSKTWRFRENQESWQVCTRSVKCP